MVEVLVDKKAYITRSKDLKEVYLWCGVTKLGSFKSMQQAIRVRNMMNDSSLFMTEKVDHMISVKLSAMWEKDC